MKSNWLLYYYSYYSLLCRGCKWWGSLVLGFIAGGSVYCQNICMVSWFSKWSHEYDVWYVYRSGLLSVYNPRVPEYVVARCDYVECSSRMVIANLDLHVCCNKKPSALPVQSVDSNSNHAGTHISQNTTSVNKAKTISRRKERIEHSINHNYSYGGNIGLKKASGTKLTIHCNYLMKNI